MGRVPADAEVPSYWRMEIPVAVRGQIVGRLDFAGAYTGEPVGETVALLAKLVEEVEFALAGSTAPPQPSTVEKALHRDTVGQKKIPAIHQ